jgi:hypothetical protein
MYPCVFVAFLFFDFFENAAWQPQGEMRDRGANAAVIGLWKEKFSNKKHGFAIMTDRDLQIP